MKVLILLFSLFALAQARADILWLTNGDIISGTLLYSDSKTTVFDSVAAGRIHIPWNQIKTLNTEGLLKLRKRGVAAAIKTKFSESKDGMVKLDDGTELALPDIRNVARIRSYTEDWKWDGDVDLSLDLKKNTDEDREEFKSNLHTRLFNVTWRHTLDADFNYVDEYEVEKTHNYTIDYSLDYFFGSPMFGRLRARKERDYFNYNQRSLDLAIGMGYQFWDNEQGRLHFTGEFVRSRYRYDLLQNEGFYLPINLEFNSIGLSWDYKQVFPVPNIEVYTFGDIKHPDTITLPYNLGGLDVRYILNSETGIRYYLIHHITLSIRFEYDREEQDQLRSISKRYLLGMGIKW